MSKVSFMETGLLQRWEIWAVIWRMSQKDVWTEAKRGAEDMSGLGSPEAETERELCGQGIY